MLLIVLVMLPMVRRFRMLIVWGVRMLLIVGLQVPLVLLIKGLPVLPVLLIVALLILRVLIATIVGIGACVSTVVGACCVATIVAVGVVRPSWPGCTTGG